MFLYRGTLLLNASSVFLQHYVYQTHGLLLALDAISPVTLKGGMHYLTEQTL